MNKWIDPKRLLIGAAAVAVLAVAAAVFLFYESGKEDEYINEFAVAEEEVEVQKEPEVIEDTVIKVDIKYPQRSHPKPMSYLLSREVSPLIVSGRSAALLVFFSRSARAALRFSLHWMSAKSPPISAVPRLPLRMDPSIRITSLPCRLCPILQVTHVSSRRLFICIFLDFWKFCHYNRLIPF